MKHLLPPIHHNQAGFQALTELAAATKNFFFDEIEIDMSKASWLDADVCAALGAIFYRLSENLNTIRLTNIPFKVENVLSKNGFLSHFGRGKVRDQWKTTIPYQRFDTKDERYFGDYIENELIHRAEMPAMSPRLLKKFNENIFEIFSNAVIHSRTKLGIFSCGQFFPGRKQLDFSVADLGVGMRQNIKDNTNLDLSPEQAIAWATEKNNTTKRGPVPGGLGLKLLSEFIDLNGGRIKIVSDAGYWERANRNVFNTSLNYPFPGTVIMLEINTADKSSYSLASESDSTDIF